MRRGLILGALLLLFGTSAWAHGGHSDPPPAPSPAAQQSMDHTMHESAPVDGLEMYGVAGDSEPTQDTAGGMYGLEEPAGAMDHSGHAMEPSLGGSELLGSGLPDLKPETAPAAGEHMGHEMGGHEQHVTPAEHKRVSTESKGYGVAIGITLLSGLGFGLLTLIRPFE